MRRKVAMWFALIPASCLAAALTSGPEGAPHGPGPSVAQEAVGIAPTAAQQSSATRALAKTLAKQPPIEDVPECKRLPAAAIREAVKGKLRDPDSARFGRAFMTCGEKFAKQPMTFICGYVNAKNGFGGYTGDQPYMIIVDLGLVEASASAKDWNRYCAGTRMNQFSFTADEMQD